MAPVKNQIQRTLDSFEGRIIGKKREQLIIAQTISVLPEKTIISLAKSTWILSTPHDTFGFVLSKYDIGDRNIIFLSDELFNEPRAQIQYTLLHEIGHVVLGHKNAFHEVRTDGDISRQEREADEFAVKYLRSDL